MNEYVIVAWLCLMLILGQVESQDQQETTINKKVARDIDMDQMPQESDFSSQLADVGNIVSNGVKNAIDIINAFAQQAKGLMQRFSTYGSR
uniref:Uncharacterized protein n=1 Tax=Vespula pensylvanica TaxID=30213 RepID=A0A834UDU6_VESPE|nr:hypothetical protein H0235_002495 [Vespula pensylvanica]